MEADEKDQINPLPEESGAIRHPAFDAFVETIATLRAPHGCPWDREQTHTSIASNMIEEAYEAVDAIEANDVPHMCEELGDVLLQVVLQSQIAEDAGEFTIDDVCAGIDAKIVRRHPHVFGEEQAVSASDVTAIWDAVKLAEQNATEAGVNEETVGIDGSAQDTKHPAALLDDVPKAFPALMQAQKISRKAVSAGFEWETLDDIWNQVFLEIEELKEAYIAASKDEKGKVIQNEEVELEMGDVLFSLVNVARRMGIDAESALRVGCEKFRRRWSFIEGAAWARGIHVEDLPLEEMESLWQRAKQGE